MVKIIHLLSFLIFVSCGGENQSAIDDFFGTGNEDEAATGTLNFSTREFREAIANDGSIENTITVGLIGRLFTGNVGEEYVGTKLIVTNLPAGLTVSAQFVNDKELLISVTGNANDHADIDDINNVTFDFDDSAFNRADEIAGKQTLVAVNYRDPYTLSYDKSIINESGANDGSFVEAFNVSVNDLEFSGSNGEDFVGNGKVTITNAPPGTTGTATKVGPNIIAISLSGNATNNATTDDISNLTVIFNSPAFPTGVSAGIVGNTTRNDLGVNFFDPALISYLPLSETFDESVSNIGFIDNQLTINVSEDTFSGSIGENYIANGKAIISNLPPGLNATISKITSNAVSVTLSGQAVNHANANDISNLTINFSANAFDFNTNIANVINSQKNDISIDFIDPYILSFNTKNFNEAGANDGSITATAAISLAGTTFVGSIGDDFVALGRVALANVPPGLTVSVIKSSANTATMSFSGNALNHEVVNNVSNISLNFLDSAFTSGAALGVNGANNSDISIIFRDPVSISYSGSTFFESASNDGSVSNSIDINLANDLFTGVNGENFLGSGKATLTPSPVTTGLVANLERISDTQLRLRFTGNASANDVDISGITLTFNPSAFVTSTSIANINGAIKNNFVLDFLDILTFAATSVNERAVNDGQIDQTVNISLTGTSFTGINGDDFVADGKVIVTNVPAGLSAVLTRSTSTSIVLSFSGTASNHTSADDVNNINILFQNSAFTSNNASAVTNNAISNFAINYLDPVNLTYDTNIFLEAVANDGSISNPINITLSGDTFTGTNGEDYLLGSKVTLTPAIPAGLTASLVRTSATTLLFNLSGNAVTHEIDQGPFTLSFDDTAFTINTDTTNIIGATRNDIIINYNDSLAYSGFAFSERAENDGLIDTVLTINLTGTDFTGSNGEDYVANSKVTVSNVPAGLTPQMIKTSNTQVLFSLVGTASSHTSADDINNLTVVFANNAFINNSANSVGNSSLNNLTISYLDPVAVSYSTDTFLENSSNDGSINNTIDLTLTNDTFTGSNGDNFLPTKATINNVPSGLTAQLLRIDSTTLRLSLSGNASSNDIDISNIELILDPSAFTITTDTTNVINATKSDIKINYYDLLTYSTRTITERALNDGQVSQTVSIALTGTSLSGSNGDDFIADSKVAITNVPAGLTPSLIRNSSNSLTLSFSGTATNNESADSVGNVTISFLDSALSGSLASALENATISDFTINFFDSVAISYSSGTFDEDLSNDGSISNTINLTAINDSFTGANGENFLTNSKATIANVPSGLTATLIKVSSSVLQFSLTGNAIDHGDIHDVSNIRLEILAAGLTITTNTTNVLNAVKSDIAVDYISPSTLDYDTLAFNESSSNNGTVANSINIDINGLDSFTGLIGDDFIAQGKVTLSNIPAGFTATVIKTASKQVRFSLTGSALSHESSDSVANVGIAFNSTALTFNNDISLVGNNSQSAIQVNFQDAATLAYSATTFNESIQNVGAVTETVNIDLVNDTFTGLNGEDFLGSGKVVISNVPTGLTPSIQKISSTRVTVSFTGNAISHADAQDISNLTINFQPSAFNFNTDVSTISNASRSDLGINFLDPYSLSYSSSTFNETLANTGELSGSSTISINGTTFAGNIGDDFVSNSMVTVQNLPAGLTASVQKTAVNQVVFTISGNATNHANINDIINLGLTFQSSAFTSGDANGVIDSTKSDFIVNFIDPYSLSFSTLDVNENAQNIGTITETITITLNGHTFSGSNGDDFLIAGRANLSGVPSGLTATLIRNSATELQLSYTGTASPHTNSEDTSSIAFTLLNSALTSGAQASDVINYNPSNLSIDFLAPYTLSANGSSFDEDGANNGSVSDTITYTLVGTTFAGANGRDLVADGHVTMTNVPSGLTAVVTKIDNNNVTLSFTGNALNHEVSDNSANTDISFLAGAFTSNNENGVIPNSFTNLSFSWDDPPSLSYSPTILVESNSNIGATNTSVSIFAANKNFNGSLGDNFVADSKVVVSGHPTGLIPVVTYASANQVNLTFTGNATNHADVNDIATGVTVAFNDSAFVGGNASQVVNGTFTGIGFDFLDPYQINYASTAFTESSLNNGAIANTISITVSGTLFTGAVSEEYVAASKAIVRNVPPGLTATVTKLSTSLVEVALSGNANDHEASDNIANLEVEFLDSAFASGAALGVNDYIRSDLSISYNNTAVLSYASSSFNESVSNVGQIDNTINITIAEDIFAGPDGENFISTAKVSASNVPVGLIPEVVKIDNTTLGFSLTGAALNHEDIHEVSNITLAFSGSAFSFNSNPGAVLNSTKNDFATDYLNAYQLNYASTSFTEGAANDGSIGNSIAISLTGTTFTGSNGDNFVADSKVTVTNIPAGLTAVMTKDSNTQVTLSFTGAATSNLNSNDISNLTVIFADTAFASGKSAGVNGYSRSDLNVDFNDQPVLSYVSGTFNESTANIGGISTTADITLSGATFSGADGDIYINGTEISFSNIPAGLTPRAQKIDSTTLRISFTGSAASHESSDSVANFGISFNDAAFNVVAAANINSTSKSDYAINFINPYLVSYSGNTFNEAVSNIGAVSGTVDITVLGTTFTGSNGSVYTNGVDATYLNTPSGLTPRLEKINDTTIRLSFTGTASSHANANSTASFGISLQDSIFTSGAAAGVSNNTKIDFNVNFVDPYVITYALGGFQEASNNNGAIATTVDIDLVGTSFSGVNSSNYTLGNQYTVANLPTGLTPVVFKVSNSKVRLFFTGTATNHEDVNDVANFTISFNDSAFVSGAAAGVLNNSKSDFFIDYISAATLAYSASTFTEDVANIGSISNALTITLSNDTFSGLNGENYVSNSKVTVANIPSGLTAVVTKTSATTVSFSLSGNASANLNADDIANLTLSFNGSAFDFNTDPTTISNFSRNDLVVDYIDQYSLAYAPSIFNESALNDGSIGNNVVITLAGSNFTTTATDFISESKIAVTNVPIGLTASVVRDSATQLTLSLSGNATNNLNSNDISNLTVTFADSAFTTGAAAGVDNAVKGDIAVNFDDQPALSYAGGSFDEADSNTGAITDSVLINLSGATFSGSNGDVYINTNQYAISNVPPGLTAVVQRISSTQVSLSFSGAATSHAIANNLSNLGITFNDNAFNVIAASNVSNNAKNDYIVNFRDPYTLSYSGSAFSESVENVGGISTSINITVSGTTFTGTNGDVYTSGVQYSFANRPTGLTVRVQKVSDTVLNLSFTSNATNHALSNSIANFTLNLLDGAFTSGSAAGVSDTTKADFTINFIDPYTLAFSDNTFTEDGANDGSVSTTIDIDITGTTFTGTNGANYTTEFSVSNVPSGLTVVVTKVNSTKLRVSLSGNASPHTTASNVSNMEIALNNSAFTSNNASGVLNSTKSDYVVNFADNASIAYSAGTFNEASSNTGAIGNSLTLTLSSDTYTGLNGENYLATGKATITNLPTGLTAQLTKTSDTLLTLTLGSSATAHADTDDISNLELELAATAFSFNTDATAVANYQRTNLIIDYLDPYLISYSTSVFNEASANNGSISNSLTLTLSGGANFTTTASDFITEGKVAISNVPAGLTPVITRDSNTQLTFSLTGNATSHDDVNDISNIRVNFANTAFDTGVREGVTNYDVSTIAIDFNDQPSLSYSVSGLTEDVANTGTFSTSIDITLTNDTFTGTNSDVYTGAKVSFANIPTGLTGRVEKISDTLVRFTLTSSASAHAIVNNISTLTINFQNAAFTNVAASNIDNSSRSDLSLTFRDPYLLSYAGNTFSESLSNDGTVSTTIDVTLTGTTFSGSNGANYAVGNQFAQSNNPASLNIAVTKINATTARISLSGTALAHADVNDISNLTINFLDNAFTSGEADGVSNTTKNDFVIDFADPATLTYSTLAINESNANNGSVSETIDIDIIGDTFTGLVNSDLIANGDITVNNLPGGLTAVATKTSSMRVTISFTGTASSHVSANDISNFGFTFLDSAFTNNSSAANVVNSSRSDLTFSFEDPYVLAYSSLSLTENGTNNGAIADTITINLSGTTFTGVDGSDFAGSKALFSNVPGGLTPVLTKDNSNQLTLSFTGTATTHTNAQDVSNLTIAFQDSAFASGAATGVDNSTVSNITVDFKDIAAISYSAGILNEDVANLGNISETLTLTLSGDEFNGNNGDNFIANTFATINNLPSGLTASLVRTSNTTAVLSLSGNASAHANANNISNLELILNANAFDFNTNASLVTNGTKSDIIINFNDPYTLAYSSTSFVEASVNNGSISQTETITLTGTSFTGNNGDNFVGSKASISNVPSGLTAVLTRLSATTMELSFTGAASNNENSHDVSNVTIIFDDTAFVSGAATGVTGFTNSGVSIDFNDRPILSYSANTFFENPTNVGTINTSIVITLANDTFSTGAFNSSKVTTSNVPSGLSASFVRDSATQLTMTLTGTAGAHASANDISNLGINFLDAAFDNVAAANITNSSRSDINVNFLDPYSLSYSGGNFNESLGNDGTIGNTITITSTGVGFSTPTVNMIIDGMVTVNNVPSGLTATVTRDSVSQVTFSLTGTADDHTNSDDIANLELIFNDSAFLTGESDGVLNSSRSNFVVDYQDPASLAYSTATFNEALANNGSISNTIDIDLSGDTFTGSNGDNFTGTKATVTGHPAGLTPVLTKISATKIRVSLTGTASTHADANDVTNLSIVFQNSAFTNNTLASNIVNYSRADLGIDFQDPATIAYSSTTFTESLSNNGTISNSLTLTLTGDTFTGSNGEDFVATSKVAVTNIPGGLTAVATKASNTTITLSLTGTSSSHVNADDIANLTVVFANTAFNNNVSALNVTGASRGDLVVDYQDPATLSYASSIFNEAASNDGTITETIVITLSGDTFTGTNGENYVGNSKVSVANVPGSMTATAIKNSATQVTIALTGTAASHANINDVTNLTFTFENTAFTNNSAAANIVNYSRNDLQVNFNDPAVIAYGGSIFNEALLNNGAIDNTISITLSGDTFTGSNGENFVGNSKVSVANVPGGLTASVTKISDTQVNFTLTGNASTHINADDVSDLTLTFNANAFTGNTVNTNVVNYTKNDFDIDYNDPYAIVYSLATFVENPATDDGSIDAPVVVSVEGTTFTGTNGDNFVSSKVTVSNVPAGLTARMVRTSDTTLNFFLDGNASPHNDTADVSNLTVTFLDSAFAINNASLVANVSKNDLAVDFFVTPVNAPTDFIASDSDTTSIDFTWTDNANNEASFDIERCDGLVCDTTWTTAAAINIPTPDTTSYTWTGLTEGSYYKFRIRAKNADTESPWVDSTMTVVFGGGTISDNGEGTSQEFRDMNCYGVSGTYAVISWNQIGANNYLIYRETGGSSTLIETVSGSTTSYVIDTLDFGSAENYRVTANMGNGVVSSNTTTADFTTSSTFAPCNVIGNDAGSYHAVKPTAFYEPEGSFIYNGNLFVSDRRNKSVLIYNTLPTSKDSVPDVVLGQNLIRDGSNNVVGITNLNFNDAEFPPVLDRTQLSANMLRCPEGIWVGDIGGTTRVMVADSCAHRVLIWNGIPTDDNADADMVIGKTNFTNTAASFPNISVGMRNPYDVTSDGTRIFVADYNNERVMVWNSFPTFNGQAPDVCLGSTDCSTNGGTGSQAYSVGRPRGILVANGKLLVSDETHDRVLIWNDVTTLTNRQDADVVIGQSTLTGSATGNGANRFSNPWGMDYDSVNDRLYIADRSNCRVQVFNGIPTANDASAIHALGATHTGRSCDGTSDYRFADVRDVSVDPVNDKIFVPNLSQRTVDAYSTIPTASAATKAFQIGTHDSTLSEPNYGSDNPSGTKSRFLGVAFDNTTGQFFASDSECDRVLVWNSAPVTANQEPDYVLGNASLTSCDGPARAQNRFNEPRNMCIVDNKLMIADYNNRRMMIYNLPISANQPGANFVLGQTNFTSATNHGSHYIDKPYDCYEDPNTGKLFINDWVRDVVNVYDTLPTWGSTTLTDHQADFILGEYNNGGRTQTRLDQPQNVVADGTNVYVSDRANGRVMIFPYPTSDSPNAVGVLGQLNYTAEDTDRGDAGIRQPMGLLIVNNKLYTSDLSFFRIMYWNLPLTQTFYQSANGIYGHGGSFDSSEGRSSSELQELHYFDIATDGKRIFGVDRDHGTIVISPLREN